MTESTLTREQLASRLAALHRASLELIKEISPEALLERIAVLAREQVQARYAAVGVLGADGSLKQFFPIGMSEDEVQQMAHPPVGKGLIGQLMRSRETIRIPVILADERHSGFPSNHPTMTSFLGVPIYSGEQQLGQIYLTDKLTAAEFSADDQQVIEILAAYAAVALQNASLYDQIRQREQNLTRRNTNLTLLNSLASFLESSTDVEAILERTLAEITSYLRPIAAEVYLTKEDGRCLNLANHSGSLLNRIWKQTSFKNGEGVVGKTALGNYASVLRVPEPIHPSHDGSAALDDNALQAGVRQVVCFPLSGRSGVLGVLCVALTRQELLDDLESQFLSTICLWVGMAVENAQLDLQKRRLAVLEERERIGMDLHDGIIQDIYAVGLTLEHVRLLLDSDPQQARLRIEQAVANLNNTIRDIRSYILDLRPRKLHEENLMDGLRRLVAEFRGNTNAEVNLKGPAQGSIDLADTHAVALFHICQEALANIAKHARATHVEITLWTTPDRVLLEIHDNGAGFDVNRVKFSIGHGLSNMQTRARSVGGDVEVTSDPGDGTTILTWVPSSNLDTLDIDL
ncbi:MAG TPA: GAF domain-containing sensor histidine kinase [Anaerolineaceae bacterium]